MDTDYNHMLGGGGANINQVLKVPYFPGEASTEQEGDLQAFNEAVALLLPHGVFVVRLDINTPLGEDKAEHPHLLMITLNFHYSHHSSRHASERFALGEWIRGLFSGFLMRHGHRVLFTP